MFCYEEFGDDGVGIVWLDMLGKKVNILILELFLEFVELMDWILDEDKVIFFVIVSGKLMGFVVGVDIDVLDIIDSVV